MENLIFNDLRKKKIHVGIRVSEAERKTIIEFCQREQITVTDLVRYSIRKVINEKSAK